MWRAKKFQCPHRAGDCREQEDNSIEFHSEFLKKHSIHETAVENENNEK